MSKLDQNSFIAELSNHEVINLLSVVQGNDCSRNANYYEAIEQEILRYILNVDGEDCE